MDGLRGVVFVAQLPSHQPEVVFQGLSLGEEMLSAPQASGSASGPATCSTTDHRGAQEKAASMQRSIISVAEDLKHAVRDCFGIPSLIFAKLMLPDDKLCNRPFYLEIDAGRRETKHRHGPWSHLLFVSFPCNVAELSGPRVMPVGVVDPRKRVQRFNVVYVLDSRLTRRQEQHTSVLWRVSAHLAQALVNEEIRDGYLSREVERLASASLEEQSSSPTNDAAATGCGLDRLLEKALEGVRKQGYSSLRVNGSVLCQVCVFPRHEAPTPPTDQQALVLTCIREELYAELGLDSADIIMDVVDAADPRTSVGELARRLAIPIRTLQRVAQHLIYWKKMRVVEVFRSGTRIDVRRGADSGPGSPLADRFHEWQQRHFADMLGQGHTVELAFSEVMSAFAGGQPLKEIEQRLRHVADFDQLLEWLVGENLLIQLAQYYHFLPGRAKTDPDWVQGLRFSERLLQEFCQAALSDFEVKLLGARAANEQQHRFLCRFASEVARAHCRIDGYRLVAFVRSVDGDLTLEQVEKILEANSDILVRYVCGC